MKSLESLANKFWRINDDTIVYHFPPKQFSRLREDNREMIYWIASECIGLIKASNLSMYLDISNITETRAQKSSSKDFKQIKKSEWCHTLISTVFNKKFGGVQEDEKFWATLRKMP